MNYSIPKNTFTLIFALLASFGFLQSQSKDVLESKRKKIENEILLTSKLLDETRSDKTSALNKYIALERRIQKRAQLIRNLNKDIELIEKRMLNTEEYVEALNDDLEKLQEEFKQILRNAYRQKLTDSKLIFLFSANSLNEAFVRWRYLKQYEAFRERQTSIIIQTQNSLLRRQSNLEKYAVEKATLLKEESSQQQLLTKELDRRNKMYLNLKGNEDELKVAIEEKQNAARQLKFALEDIIKTEIKQELPMSISPTITSDFERSKGNMSWPINNGVVIGFFGQQDHPTIKNIKITNNGIDIQSSGDGVVRAVLEGEVVGKFSVPGNKRSILIKHGDFFTVYANLESVFVERGDLVKTLQSIGSVNKTNSSELHFEIWRQKVRLNPLDWLRP